MLTRRAAPVSLNRAYHKILGVVKRSRVIPLGWGCLEGHKRVGTMKV